MIKESQKPMFKGIAITVLSLMLLITLPFITSLIRERENFQGEVTSEVTSKWGQEQTLYGPFILIEYKERSVDSEGKVLTHRTNYLQVPEKQVIIGDIKTQVKKRSLYEVALYNTNLAVEARFPTMDKIIEKLKVTDPADILSTKLIFSISDSKGFTEEILINNIAGQAFELDRDLGVNTNYNFLSYEFDRETFNTSEINFPIKLKGSTEINFLASAKDTKVDINPDYKDIKYVGNYLPDTDEKQKDTVSAKWTIFQPIPINTSLDSLVTLDTYKFGMKFIQVNDFYSKVNRATKYALLFIGLTFATFFFMENLKNLSINILHYTLVGLSLCINFVLLLSFAEYVGFSWAYIISASATILLITSFIYGLSKNFRIAASIFGLLAALYAFLFFLLQLKEAALIVGSIGLFAVIAVLMYFSKRIKFGADKSVDI